MSLLPACKVIATITQIDGLYSIPASAQPEAHIAQLLVSDLHRTLGHCHESDVPPLSFLSVSHPVMAFTLTDTQTTETPLFSRVRRYHPRNTI
jgi:hypothetical protein